MTRMLLPFVLLGGCVISSNPAKGTAPTGAPLLVKSESGTGTYTSNDVVSTETVKDNAGNEIGTIEHREDREHSYDWHVFSLHQGADKLDEQDFYRIAGDQESESKVKSVRTKAIGRQRLGRWIAIGSLVLGAGMLAGGIAMDMPGIAGLSLVPLVMGTMTGGMVWMYGYKGMEGQIIPEARAKEVSDLVQSCIESNCRIAHGGRRFRGSEAASLQMREAEPQQADEAPVGAPLVGAWRGMLSMEIQQAGQPTSQVTKGLSFSVEDAGEGKVVLLLDPELRLECRFEATVSGKRAELAPTSCAVRQNGELISVTMRPGSWLEQRGAELAMAVTLDVVTTSRRGKKERGSLSWTGTGKRLGNDRAL
jgi:hypothetical protein